MFRKAWIILILIMALCLCACDTAVPGETTGTPTTVPGTTPPVTTAPPKTTAPPETTVPAEPMYSAAPVVQAEYVVNTDVLPEFDFNVSGGVVVEAGGENPRFEVSYIRLPAAHALGYRPLDGNAFWICEDPQEMKSESHYKNYVVENGQLQQLQKRTT